MNRLCKEQVGSADQVTLVRARLRTARSLPGPTATPS
jgi:hypothetical protein